jgi:hypothetical protein
LGKAFVTRKEKRNSLRSGNSNRAKAYAAGIQMIIDTIVVVVATIKDSTIDPARFFCDRTKCHHFRDSAEGKNFGYWYSSANANMAKFINGPKKKRRKTVNRINSRNFFLPKA